MLLAVLLLAAHAPLLRLPYFWDEAGYYIPAARDLLTGSLIPHSTPSNAHPPLVLAWIALVPLLMVCAGFSIKGELRHLRLIPNSPPARYFTTRNAYCGWFQAKNAP